MKIETVPPVEPVYYLTLTRSELSVIYGALSLASDEMIDDALKNEIEITYGIDACRKDADSYDIYKTIQGALKQ